MTTDSEGDLILDLDADPRNAEWVNIVHVHTLAGHRLPGWAALWLGWLAHDRGPTFWQRVATVAGEAGLEKLPANPKLREEPRSILAGVDDIIERHLGIGQIGTRQPRYAHLSACRALSGAPRFAFDSAKLIDEMLERIKANWMGGAAMRPSSNENWRFQKQLHIAAHNLSPETTLEKRIASVMDGAWVNQVPTASGLVNSATDKRRNLDLVHRVAPGEFAFIELKVGSNTPLHAAMELLEYAVLYLFARLNAEPRDLHKQGLLTAIAVHLRVLAPAPYYQRFCFDWLEKDLTNGLNAVIAKNGLRLRMDFAFWAFPHEFAWPCSDETLVAAVDGRRQVRWTT